MAKTNQKENLDISSHKKMTFNIAEEALKELKGKDVISAVVAEEKETKKKEYVKHLKNIITEGNKLEEEVKQMRANPDQPEAIDPKSGQVVKQATVSRSYYKSIKEKTARIDNIIDIIDATKNGDIELLRKDYKNAKK